MLDTVEEPLDLVAQFVNAWAEGGWINTVVERADVGKRTAVCHPGAQGIAVIAAIGQQNAVWPKRLEHFDSGRTVVRLPFGQLERDRQAVAIDDRVDLGRKPAAGAAHATTSAAFFSPLAAC